jgi:negative regulator of flagellin synthesis FlgM
MTGEDDSSMDAIGRMAGSPAAMMAASGDSRAAAVGETRAAPNRPPAFERAATPAPLAAALSPLVRDMASAPPVDSERVAQLRDAIVRGDYRPEPMKIAAAMLALEAPTQA